MTGTGDMNIIVGQGAAVKEVHNVKKQNLEINQQFVAQETEGQKKKDKSKIQKLEHGDKIKIKSDQEDRSKEEKKNKKKGSKKKKSDDEFKMNASNLIDIKV
jgi:hypothetical protein